MWVRQASAAGDEALGARVSHGRVATDTADREPEVGAGGTYLSLFSGIGGLDLGVEAVGFRCVGQVEWDRACSAVLDRWWPDVPRWGDVADFSAAAYAEGAGGGVDTGRAAASGASSVSGRAASAVGREAGAGVVDLIVGGFPCQPFSHAGRRSGKDDERYLWPEFHRVILEIRPRWVFIENVPGLFTLRRPMGDGAGELVWEYAVGDILRDLAEAGFDAEWCHLRASAVGAPHRRERVFILAERADADGQRLDLGGTRLEQERDRGEPQPRSGGLGEDVAVTERERLEGTQGAGIEAGGSTARYDREAAADPEDADRWAGESGEQEASGERRSEPGGFAWGPYATAIGRWESVMGPAPMPIDGKERLSPAFVEWMMGFPIGWTEGMSRTQALKALGNAVVPQQAAAAFASLTFQKVGV